MPLLNALLLTIGAAAADSDCSAPAPDTRTVKLAAGPQYKAGQLHELFLGTAYRRLWTTPIDVPVLDLHAFAGGLTVKERAGSKQTRGLKLESNDGRRFRFRSTDKMSSLVSKALRDTFVDSIVTDQISANHPFGALVVTPLSRAAGIPTVARCLFVLPDDPALGEFQKEFARVLGTIEETPRVEAPVTPGFEDMTQLLEAEELMTLVDAGPKERIDARAFLKARLFDVWIGDWDRHQGQFDWGRRRSDGRWQPVPSDRDEAFASHNGLLLGLARAAAPRIMHFKPEYRKPLGYIWNSRDQDRRLLAGLDRAEWNEVVAELQRSLSDAAIDHSVAQLPRELRGTEAPRLAAILKARRERLPRQAHDLYRLISDKVDVYATSAHEVAEIRRFDSGEVELSLATLDDRSAPYFRRRFVPSDTAEIRVYLNDGNDRIVTMGDSSRGPHVRIIGGNGKDVMEGAKDGISLYDTEGPLGASDSRPYEEKLDENGNRPFDWGSSLSLFPTADVESDIGLIVGGALRYQSYGFRAQPYRSRQTFSVETATRTGWRLGYEGEWRRTNSPTYTQLVARYSEIEALRFFGFGNETPRSGETSFYHVDQKQYLLAPTWVMPRGAATFSIGPVAKYSTTNLGAERFIGALRPYGSEDYGQLGAQAGIDLDTREPRNAARKGVRVRGGGSFYPAVWSVRESFGEAHGDASLHVPIPAPLEPSLAFRVGGKRLFGLYPFHEAAYLGGTRSVRGLSRNRFAGDAYAFGNAELRLRLGKIPVILPVNTGIFGLADIGRVFVAGESSDRWHTSVGGGVWFSAKHDKYVVSFTSARSEGHVSFYVKSALAF